MAAAAGAVAVARRRVTSHFLSQDAVTPEKAVFYEPGNFLQRRMFERLQSGGVIEREGQRYWLNIPAYHRSMTRRLKIVGGTVLAIGAAALAGLL